MELKVIFYWEEAKGQDKRSVLFKIGEVALNIFIWIAMFIAIFGGSYETRKVSI